MSSLARSRYLSPFFAFFFFSFTLWSTGMTKSTIFFLTITRSRRLAEIRWSFCISKSQRILCISFSRVYSGLYWYHLIVWSNLNFLHNYWWISFPTQSCQVIYFFALILLHSLIMWLIVSSLSPHNIHLLFFLHLVYTCFGKVRMELFWVAIRRNSVSFLRFPFLGHVQDFSREISLVRRLKCPFTYFSSHFCFQVIFVFLMLVLSALFLVAVISFPLHFLCYLLVFVSLHQRYLECWRVPSLRLFLKHSVFPRMWKILTAEITEEIYDSLISRRLFPEEEKGCRKGTSDWSTHPQGEQNQTEKWSYAVDRLKKAYDMVQQSWIIDCSNSRISIVVWLSVKLQVPLIDKT